MRLLRPFGSILLALLLASCIVDGNRGQAFTRGTTYQPQAIGPWRYETTTRVGTRTEREETAVLVALTSALVETQRTAAQMALERLSSEPLREHAAMASRAAEDALAALRTVTIARGLALSPATLSNDPLFVAQRNIADQELARLRSLSGETFARAWLAGERQRLELLASLGTLGQRMSPDVAAGNAFRMVAHDARTQADRGVTTAETLADG